MSTIEGTNTTLNEREGATTISANARIDYILRFSKHAVLVIDDNTEIYTNVGNEFLGSLSTDHNAAFVSISSKLNDIQIRCRIIEQLFGNTLFDPEQPLSVNVVKLAEAKNEAITIVIANVEFLSLQLSHELCQLAQIAKKLNKTINVILLGTTEAAINLSENKHLFENKVSILLAGSGQLISWNSSLLKRNKSHLLIRSIIILFIIAVSALAIFFSLGYFSSNESSGGGSIDDQSASSSNEYKKAFVKANTDSDDDLLLNKAEDQIKLTTASSGEIFELLMIEGDGVIENEDYIESVESNNTEVVSSSILTSDENIDLIENTPLHLKTKTIALDSLAIPIKNESGGYIKSEDYYQGFINGYVVQLGNFKRLEGYKSFFYDHKDHSLHGYIKADNGVTSYIVTTQVYKTIPQAKIAIKDLSKELRDRGPWIKSVQAINNEINLYKQSQ